MAYGVPGSAVPRERVPAARNDRHGPPRHSVQDLEHRPAQAAEVLEKLSLNERGLILVTGTTGSGKSTTLAAMIDHINSQRTAHIVTIEDPIEFLMRDKRSVINQREVGVDTMGFAQALRSALRQDPDVILVGEMRDLETIETALTAAETGHLVVSTLPHPRRGRDHHPHRRGLPALPAEAGSSAAGHDHQGIVSQRLVPMADGRGRVAAAEVLISTATTREMIEDPERTKELRDAIAKRLTRRTGCRPSTSPSCFLIKQGLINYEEALRNCSNPDDFALRFQGISSTSDSKWDEFEAGTGQARSERPRRPRCSGCSGTPRGRRPAEAAFRWWRRRQPWRRRHGDRAVLEPLEEKPRGPLRRAFLRTPPLPLVEA